MQCSQSSEDPRRWHGAVTDCSKNVWHGLQLRWQLKIARSWVCKPAKLTARQTFQGMYFLHTWKHHSHYHIWQSLFKFQDFRYFIIAHQWDAECKNVPIEKHNWPLLQLKGLEHITLFKCPPELPKHHQKTPLWYFYTHEMFLKKLRAVILVVKDVKPLFKGFKYDCYNNV